ncbi:UDP-4-amino-4,6-dideoxy-N-acetyl-beta-L-altrosamine transaminase [Rheinheimera sp.]|uniref:UDP-4-amino-4, 6-dideoxy-N-acetyl-beta-L-altrosamine transaminase n=1 Tax=Rheinheimera sp. TaxID=1869214 RepID=UPI00307F002A
MIPYGRQHISQQDINAVLQVLQSDFLTQGPAVPAFEHALAGLTGAKDVVAVNSATSALHIACLALGVGPQSRVWTSPISFVASANCALYCGAVVDFVDVELQSGNMDMAALARKLEAAAMCNELPDLVIPVHLAGYSCDMQQLQQLAQSYGFKVIEDASHAVGAEYSGKPVGCCTFSDITVFSFHPVKIITTAEGGAALTNQPPLAEAMRRLRSHGITRDPALMQDAPDGPWYYQQLELGFNYRMTELQGALGLSQSRQLTAFVSKRRELAKRYNRMLAESPLVLPPVEALERSAWHLYIVQLQQPEKRLEVFNALRAAGIGVNVHYIPIHTQPYYQQLGFSAGDFPQAEQFYRGIISLPLYPDLTEAQQNYICEQLVQLL